MTPAIVPMHPQDRADLPALYAAAFPDEDLLPLLSRMAAEVPDLIVRVARADLELVGHVAVTPGQVAGVRVGLLAPLAVAPAHQRQGIGGALIAAAAQAATAAGLVRLLVLGDPRYYGGHGFAMETAILPPCPPPLPAAWQGRPLAGGSAPAGALILPRCWLDPALWTAPG